MWTHIASICRRCDNLSFTAITDDEDCLSVVCLVNHDCQVVVGKQGWQSLAIMETVEPL